MGRFGALSLVFQKDNKVSPESTPPVLNSKQTTTGETNLDNLSAIIPKIEEPPPSLNKTDIVPKTSPTTTNNTSTKFTRKLSLENLYYLIRF